MRDTNREKGMLTKKIDNLQSLQYMADQEVISRLINDWCDARPDNRELQAVRSAWIKTIFYINKLEMDRDTYSIAYSDLMGSKNTEIERLGELLTKVTNENIELDQDIVK